MFNKFFPKLNQIWHNRINEILMMTGLLPAVWHFSSMVAIREISLTDYLILTSIGVSFLSSFYAIFVYKRVRVRWPNFCGYIAVFMLGLNIALLNLTTDGYLSIFLTLWLIYVVISGVYGWFVLLLNIIAQNSYFLVAFINSIDTTAENNFLLYIAIVNLAPILGFIIWQFHSKDDNIEDNSLANLTSDLASEKIRSEVVISSISDGVVMIDKTGIIKLFNTGLEKICGWSKQDSIGLDYRSIIKLVNDKDEAYNDTDNPFISAYSTKKEVRDNKAFLITKSKKKISVFISVTPLFSPTTQELDGVVGVVRDVSTERNEEQQRAEFISTASHEMRTPVAAIEGYLSLAMNEKVAKIDTKAREYLIKAHSSTQHLGKLFQDLLTAAKSEDGRLSNHPIVVDLGQLLHELADNLKFSAEKKGLGVDFVIGTNTTGGEKVIRPIYYCLIDPDRFREVITNLFDNAIKYTDQGRITLGLTGNDNVIQVWVKDTGPGIPAEDMPHLFQKFYRVDNSSTRTVGGTGLGLFICRKIIELYEGRIWVQSQVDQGSTFYINLPRLSTDEAQKLKSNQQFSPLDNTSISNNNVA